MTWIEKCNRTHKQTPQTKKNHRRPDHNGRWVYNSFLSNVLSSVCHVMSWQENWGMSCKVPAVACYCVGDCIVIPQTWRASCSCSAVQHTTPSSWSIAQYTISCFCSAVQQTTSSSCSVAQLMTSGSCSVAKHTTSNSCSVALLTTWDFTLTI